IAKTGATSPRVACFDFGSEEWDFQVIIDGYHEQPRIFNAAGELLGEGLGIYIRSDKNTKLTAALPLDIIGDPSYGEWSFIVMTGFTDLHNSALIAAPAKEGEKGIYQYFKGTPLKINNPL
ncbi:MAG: hypothetical protein MUF15_03560, partial [Acidobacteria bacterium]|nr:hypothetical protein [Acidobacteriota bacterium]